MRSPSGIEDRWIVSGPPLRKDGRVNKKSWDWIDYGSIDKETGAIRMWAGKGALGKLYMARLEAVRDRLKRRIAIASRRTR